MNHWIMKINYESCEFSKQNILQKVIGDDSRKVSDIVISDQIRMNCEKNKRPEILYIRRNNEIYLLNSIKMREAFY